MVLWVFFFPNSSSVVNGKPDNLAGVGLNFPMAIVSWIAVYKIHVWFPVSFLPQSVLLPVVCSMELCSHSLVGSCGRVFAPFLYHLPVVSQRRLVPLGPAFLLRSLTIMQPFESCQGVPARPELKLRRSWVCCARGL